MPAGSITIRYEINSLTWTQKLSDQLNLAHVTRNNKKKKKLKQTIACAHLVQYRFKIRESSLEGIRMTNIMMMMKFY